jgi:glucokinase
VSQQLLVGFDFGGTKLATVLADLDGTRLAGEVLPTEAERGAEQAVRRAIAAARDLLSSRGAGVAAVGVATMGITRDDHVELAPNVPGWDRLALPQLLRDEFGSAPVANANDVRADRDLRESRHRIRRHAHRRRCGARGRARCCR